MTKHIGSGKIDNNVETMRMKFIDGRSAKAAKLHLIEVASAKTSWNEIRKAGHEQRGGDSWVSR